jgi:hypothetical protein
LGGTSWQHKSTAVGDSFRVPGSVPVNPSDFPQLPGSVPPSLADFGHEGFTRSDPRLTDGLSGFPAASPDWQRFGQLPPTTATPSDPLILRFDPMTGAPLPFHENPLAREPNAQSFPSSSSAQSALPWLIGGAALGASAPFLPAWLLAIGGIAAISRAASAHELDPAKGARATGGVFSTGAPGYNAFNNSSIAGTTTGSRGYPASSMLEPPLIGHVPPDQEATRGSAFDDRFGNWTGTPAGSAPVTPDAAAGTIAPEEVRRLTRVNASNAGSVFESGSSPVPQLPSPEFNDRFGNWSMPTGERPQQASRPVGAFADEPSYLVPPPIWGLEDPGNPQNDAEEWFSRWIRPLLRQE